MVDLRAHMTHHQEATFKCDTCGHQMNRSDQYDDHMAMHLGETENYNGRGMVRGDNPKKGLG
ncbi:hypothetical protein DPMN_045037 [Dreissena polymorpha]|uniref:C2H2-type domain-containing protein n=1 Tax=Dreissena polymorpha TaxID=45954 RepID=A0A9D4D582_DREPO|nr:hypothetical protein DPMN_045037 [Dreissena polymorpha]